MAEIQSNSSDEDEWAVDDLPLPSRNTNNEHDEDGNHANDDGGDDYWTPQKSMIPADVPPTKETKESESGDPMIIVDLTTLSNSAIHSKFDENAVNDTVAASALKKTIECNYEQYANDSALLSSGTVIPCGTTVWRMALIQLREERQGHYFAPIFPPKKL